MAEYNIIPNGGEKIQTEEFTGYYTPLGFFIAEGWGVFKESDIINELIEKWNNFLKDKKYKHYFTIDNKGITLTILVEIGNENRYGLYYMLIDNKRYKTKDIRILRLWTKAGDILFEASFPKE